MLNEILKPSEQELLIQERELLADLQTLAAELEASEADREALDQSIGQLDQLFLLVVVGEFNAGKSAFINALIGSPVLPEGVTPTTTRIQILQYGEPRREVETPSLERISVDADALHQIQIVDTPGTNAIQREHEALTRDFVPRSDLVLFVTSADRPFTESERAFLERIRQWGKKIVVVINKIDILEGAEEVETVRNFVSENLRSIVGAEPRVYTVSARETLKRKSGVDTSVATPPTDQFAEVERYIHRTLDQGERLRLKLLNPLGVGRNLARDQLDKCGRRLQLVETDLKTLQQIESQLELYQEDMEREFHLRLAEVDRVLHAFESRGVDFFDDRMRLSRLLDLLNKSRLKSDFQASVIGQAPSQIEACVDDLIDWMVAAEIRQWEQIREHLEQGERRTRLSGRSAGFEQDRRRLIDSVGRHAQQVLESYDKEREASRMAEDLQRAVAGTAIVEVGALGLGALVNLLATTTLADVTGLVAAGAVAVLGLFVIPARRREAKRQLKERINQMRRRLIDGLTTHFQREQKAGLSRIREAVAPYSRFVRSEERQLRKHGDRLQDWLDQSHLLELKIGDLSPESR